MSKREFHLQDDRSSKFWTIEVVGSEVVTGNGRIGARPREARTAYATPELAQKAAEKEILAKRKKGYSEGSAPQPTEPGKRLPPKLIRINHDDHYARYVGKTRTGDQFFLTFPFAPAVNGDGGGSFVALYLFDAFGALKDSRISTAPSTATAEDALTSQLLASLGGHKFGNIKVSPFAVQAFDRVFGLVFDPGEESSGDEDDEEEASVWVTAEPGNYMAFFPPWDGEYDT